MEPFLDFGLFEILAASGIAALARLIYRRKTLARLVILTSAIAPIVLLFLVHEELARWIVAICLATSTVNAGALWPMTRAGPAGTSRS
jgi:hypothetical protein